LQLIAICYALSMTSNDSIMNLKYPPRAVTFSWWGIVYLNDPDSYMLAGDFILLLRPPKSDW